MNARNPRVYSFGFAYDKIKTVIGDREAVY